MFQIGDIPAQRITIYPAKDELVEMYGVLIENARISGIQAVRAFQDKLDFRLEFNINAPMDKSILELCDRFYKDEIYVSMAPMQPVLFDAGQVAAGQIERCEECGETASFVDSENAFFCQRHQRKGKGEIKLIVKKETPLEAEARVMREKAAAAGGDVPVEDIRDENIASAEEINRRASKKRGAK